MQQENGELRYQNNVLVLTSVREVVRVEEKEVFVNLGNRGLSVRGSNLKVLELNISTGVVRIDGAIDAITYTRTKEKQSLLTRLFK